MSNDGAYWTLQMYATCNLVPAAKPRYNHTVSPLHAKYFFVLSNFKTSSDDRHIAGFPFSSRLYLWVDKGNLFLCFETLFYGGEGERGRGLTARRQLPLNPEPLYRKPRRIWRRQTKCNTDMKKHNQVTKGI
jgi:hypothetical protein